MIDTRANVGDSRQLQVMSPNNPGSSNVGSAHAEMGAPGAMITPIPRTLQHVSSGEQETLARYEDAAMSSASPTKEQMRSEMQALKMQVYSIECEANAHHEHQRTTFRIAAESYASEAREINRAEISQTEAMAASFYASNMKLLESAAHAQLGAQRTSLITEAESAMLAQRTNTIAEAEQCLEQQRNCANKAFQELQNKALAQHNEYRVEYQKQEQRLRSLSE